jgi:glycogen debranching enzyme
MNRSLTIPDEELIEIPRPQVVPRLTLQTAEPRKVDSLTLIDGKTFSATNIAGDIHPSGSPDFGFFHDDTRFLSHLELRIGGYRTVVLSSSTEKSFFSQIELTTGNITLRDSFDLPENTVHIRREQLLASDIFFDSLALENFNLTPVDFIVEMLFDADFLDVYQVRGAVRQKHGQYYRPVVRGNSIAFYYRGLDSVMRETLVKLAPKPTQMEERSARWDLRLEPLRRLQVEISITPFVEGCLSRAQDYDRQRHLQQRRSNLGRWEVSCTNFHTDNEVFDELLKTCIADFHALQIPEGEQHVIAAGIPWFATIFGRDSIIAAYQSLSVNSQLAVDTLRVLARHQGREFNDWRDEEPGKILHEYRAGEMTRNGEMPFSPYYGSIDATPLFLILLSETFNWTGDEKLITELLPNASAALEWIDKYGDLDGDGFVEFQRRSPKGLINQGWKDSWDANLHSDGTPARAPISPCEVQGYVYDAKYRMSSLLRAFGDVKTAEKLKRDAIKLAHRFERSFWLPNRGFYAMALDAEKKPLEVIASNPGHLLFTRLISKDRARIVCDRLLREDMFSGWGCRTMSMKERVFNPLSYHRGSVWPHDNSIIAHGMAVNEMRDGALRILTSLYQAALKFRDYRLPELFCGVQRREHDEPVHYPVSCSPQAWASGAMFLMLASVLGIRASAPRKELNIINPRLPDWLDHLYIRGLRIGRSRVGLDFARRGDRTFCNVVDVEGDKMLVNVTFKK